MPIMTHLTIRDQKSMAKILPVSKAMHSRYYFFKQFEDGACLWQSEVPSSIRGASQHKALSSRSVRSFFFNYLCQLWSLPQLVKALIQQSYAAIKGNQFEWSCPPDPIRWFPQWFMNEKHENDSQLEKPESPVLSFPLLPQKRKLNLPTVGQILVQRNIIRIFSKTNKKPQ